MPYDDRVRGHQNWRSTRSPLSPAPTADSVSMRSLQPSFTQWSEPPSCYSHSRMSMDGTCSEVPADDATSGHRGESELCTVLLAERRGIVSRGSDMSSNTVYRESCVDSLGSSGEDGRQDDVPASPSDDTLSGPSTHLSLESESDTSISGVSGDTTPDPRLSFLGPKTRMISKAPWEEAGADEGEGVSDTEALNDDQGIFAGMVEKFHSPSRILTQAKAEKERRFLGGGGGRASTDTRSSMDSSRSRRSMESSAAPYLQTSISPRHGIFAEAARTPSLFSTSSGASSGSGAPPASSGARIGMNRDRNASGGLIINACGLDPRATSPTLSSPTDSNFVHPYANPESLPSGHDGEVALWRSNSSTTLTTSTASPCITPSSSTSSATSPGPALVNFTKSPSALSTSFVPLSPPMLSTSAAATDDSIAGCGAGLECATEWAVPPMAPSSSSPSVLAYSVDLPRPALVGTTRAWSPSYPGSLSTLAAEGVSTGHLTWTEHAEPERQAVGEPGVPEGEAKKKRRRSKVSRAGQARESMRGGRPV